MKVDSKLLSLEERVFATLEEDILTGKFSRGDSLGENMLSEMLGVSRTPVRAALKRLAEEGLIEAVANKGAVVIGITKDDIVDIYHIRMRLEGLASLIAASKISAEALGELLESVELSEFYIKKNNTEKLKELDSEFHETIYKATGNAPLCKTLSELHRKIKSYRKLSLNVPGRLEMSVKEHREIYEAIASGNGELADTLTSLHVKRALDNMLAVFDSEKN
ncbi:MAG: GntR family transcriptional regulator [Clostridia bacterium]|nr:GntR family transcriptional regulator [Clostridia bacterium]